MYSIAEAQEEVWPHVSLIVTLEMSATLLRPFSDTELHVAMASLDASSSHEALDLIRTLID